MKSLETLILSKNQIAHIPVELSNCTTMTEILLSDNNIIEIPTKIMSMPNLKVMEAESKCLNFSFVCIYTNVIRCFLLYNRMLFALFARYNWIASQSYSCF